MIPSLGISTKFMAMFVTAAAPMARDSAPGLLIPAKYTVSMRDTPNANVPGRINSISQNASANAGPYRSWMIFSPAVARIAARAVIIISETRQPTATESGLPAASPAILGKSATPKLSGTNQSFSVSATAIA